MTSVSQDARKAGSKQPAPVGAGPCVPPPKHGALPFYLMVFDRTVDPELHIFQAGRHGMSVDNELTRGSVEIDSSVTQWVPLALAWLGHLFAPGGGAA